MDDKVDEGKGWSARQAPTTKTHNTHILVVSKRTHYCSKYLSIKFTTPTPALSKVLKKTKTLFSRARGSTCYQPGRRAQTERSSSDQDLPATTVQLVPEICRHPPFYSSPGSAGHHQSTRPQDLPAPTHRSTRPAAAHHRGLVAGATLPTRVPAGKSNRQREWTRIGLDGKKLYNIGTVLYVLSYEHHLG